ncbi:DNA mismatch repair endonuclease MutL [Treponema pedis]|uniref:DNA mismatch repair endonuclease MutL n=1 Tax=Treponema pedis TaxID=409322 RepID=UPI00041F950A|nr:DNA mismatch repair endonuclease MutL [Treponema pedis]
MGTHQYKPIKILSKETAGKIAAGEVIERPSSVVRELLDNSIDAGASKIILEITEGGTASIRVCDNGCGMTREDLEICTHTHTTSKIQNAEDLLSLKSLGFRGEALASIQAVSSLEITTTREGPAAWKLSLGKIFPDRLNSGTVIEVKSLFANFPARKKFLKRAQYEAAQCKQIFIEKALPHYNIEMHYVVDGANKILLPSHNSLKERCLAAMALKEPEELFYEINQTGDGFSFTAVLGSPAVVRSDKRHIYVFVNGRRITEYGLVQAVIYGAEGYFPNGGFPVAFLFLTVNPERVDFNIHPAKKEARFEDYKEIHHAVSSSINNFYKQKTVSELLKNKEYSPEFTKPLNFSEEELKAKPYYGWSEQSAGYAAHSAYQYRSGYTGINLRHDDVKGSFYAEREKNFINGEPNGEGKNNCEYEFFEKAGEAVRSYTPDETLKDVNNKTSFPADMPKSDFKFLGQFCGTFIAVEKNDALYIIDQHAAHERILFEELKKHLGSSQELLIPYKIETESEKDDEIIRLNLEELKKAGFNITEEKRGVWLITAVPIRWHGTEKNLQEDLAEAGKAGGGIMHHILASSACRAACKDGDIIDAVSAYNIAVKTFSLSEPLCPHGRPLYFIIDREELFKRIKRT